MVRGRKALSETATEDYFSDSSIDNPPSDPSELKLSNKQDEPDPNVGLPEGERLFGVELTLSLKPEGGKAVKVPLFASKQTRGTLVEDCLDLAIKDRLNRTIVGAVLSNPGKLKR